VWNVDVKTGLKSEHPLQIVHLLHPGAVIDLQEAAHQSKPDQADRALPQIGLILLRTQRHHLALLHGQDRQPLLRNATTVRTRGTADHEHGPRGNVIVKPDGLSLQRSNLHPCGKVRPLAEEEVTFEERANRDRGQQDKEKDKRADDIKELLRIMSVEQ
jgi:hypothetical protein